MKKTKNSIKDESYWIKELNATPSKKYKANGVTRWDVEGNVYLNRQNLTKLPLQFGVVTGYFNCGYNKLEILDGAPQYVGGGFYCDHNNLKTLEGAPIEVGGDFICHNNKLESLEGSPIEVGEDFYCHDNQLESLEGLSKYIGGDLYFSNNPLEQLNALMGVQIKGEIQIYNNDFSKALQNTNLDALEYILSNHRYRFDNDEIEKEFYMHLEQIVIKKRLEKDLFI